MGSLPLTTGRSSRCARACPAPIERERSGTRSRPPTCRARPWPLPLAQLAVFPTSVRLRFPPAPATVPTPLLVRPVTAPLLERTCADPARRPTFDRTEGRRLP